MSEQLHRVLEFLFNYAAILVGVWAALWAVVAIATLLVLVFSFSSRTEQLERSLADGKEEKKALRSRLTQAERKVELLTEALRQE